MAENGSFNPSEHLIDIQGKQYLPVNWRLFWLRDAHPDADVETEMIRESEDQAVFKARVLIPGRGSATGYGSETRDDFGDFIEKAETKAIGRALAALGFGTQFCDDFDEGGAVTDAPVQRDAPRPARSSFAKPTAGKRGGASDAQMKYLWGDDSKDRPGLIFQKFADQFERVTWLEEYCEDALGVEEIDGERTPVLSRESLKGIGSMQASDLISKLKDMPDAVI